MEFGNQVIMMKSGDSVSKVTKFINKNYGLDIPEKLKPLAVSELEKFKTKYKIKDWSVILANQGSQERTKQLSELLEIFTVDHTNFFRNKIHFEILKNDALPYLLSEQGHSDQTDLRIWSAGCSTGEEVFSILVALFEYFGVKYKDITCGVLATDISRSALKKTELGIYNTAKVAKGIQSRLENYIELKGGGLFQFNEKLRREITLRDFNLNSKVYPFRQKFHVIFCRNVLLYFNRESRENTQEKLVSVLDNGGFIFIGDAENLDFENFGLKKIGNGVFQKPDLV